MDKICNVAILIAFILAIVAAFVPIPYVAAILLILGGIGGANTADKPEYRVRLYGAGAILILGAHMLVEIPVVGNYLAGIFTAAALIFVGASVVAITLAIIYQLRNNLMK